MKLKLLVLRIDSQVIVRILKQTNRSIHVYERTNKLVNEFECVSSPDLEDDKLFLRGDCRSYDNTVVSRDYSTKGSADIAAKDIKILEAKTNGMTHYEIETMPLNDNVYRTLLLGGQGTDADADADADIVLYGIRETNPIVTEG